MKTKIGILTMTLMLGLMGCGDKLSLPEKVEGSGKVVKLSREVGDFRKITLAGSGNMVLTQTDHTGFVIETDDNIVEHIKTTVEDDNLHIQFEQGVLLKPSSAILYHIGVKELEGLSLSGSGEITSTGPIEGDDLRIVVAGNGTVELELDYDDVDSTISGSGVITLKGEVDNQSVTISGNGKYHAKLLESDDAKVNIAGSGEADVNVDDDLEVVITGNGQVKFKGSASVSQQIMGTGSIEAIDEDAEEEVIEE